MTSRTVPIRAFGEEAGIGHSKTYQLINEREIKSFLVGKRRLIDWDSWLDYLERQQEAEENGVRRIASPNPRAAANRNGSPAKPASRATANEGAPAPRRRRGRPRTPRSRP